MPMVSAPHDDPEVNKMPLMAHLLELRRRLMYSALTFVVAFFACYSVASHIYDILVLPLARIMAEVGGSQRMIYTALTEAFFTYIKIGAFGAMVVSFPIFASQLWMFIAPGLYKHEKKAFLPFLFVSPLLFAAGAALVYFFVIPMAWSFLLGFQTTQAETVLPIQLEAKVGEYLDLVMKLILAFGVSFQLPVVLTLMGRVGLVSSRGLADKRKYAVVAVFIFAAVVTPPDVISQVGLAIPMLLLYEISIISVRMVEKKRGDTDDDSDDDSDGTDDPAPKSGAVAAALSDRGDDPTGETVSISKPTVARLSDNGLDGVEETDFNA
jgi:sec-independent protein translocase protein TatC